MIKNNKLEKCAHTIDYLPVVREIKSELKKYLHQNKPVLKPEDIERIILTEGSIKAEEETIKNVYIKDYEPYKTAYDAYKAIYTKTKNLELNESKKEIFRFFDFDLNNNLIGETLTAYPIESSQKFFVHATSLPNALPLIEVLKKNEFTIPSFCTSLMDARTGFFKMKEQARAALLLAIDPEQIILTYPFDIGSPSTYGNYYNHDQILQFYNIQEKIIVMDVSVNQILNSFEDKTALNKFKSTYDLNNEVAILKKKQQDLVLDLLKEEFPNQNFDFMTNSNSFQGYFFNIKNKSKLLEIHKIMADGHKSIKSLIYKDFLKFFQGYYADSEKNVSPEEFFKIFNRPGSNILKEFEKYEQLIDQLIDKNSVFYITSLLDPEELLKQTLVAGSHAQFWGLPYNEVNVKLDFDGKKNNPEVKGIVITRENLERFSKPPQDKDELEEWIAYADLIKHAQSHNLKIVMAGDKRPKMAKL